MPLCVTTRRASEIMRKVAPVVSPADHLRRAAELMERFGVREVAVVDGTSLVGILARSDLEPHVGQLEWTPVRVAMTSRPTTVAADATVSEVARALLEGSFNGVPVVVGAALAGMISRQDILRLLADCPVPGSD